MLHPLSSISRSQTRSVVRRSALLSFHGQSVVFRRANHGGARQFKVTLDGETLYIEQDLAQALGWREGAPTEGIPLRLSGWSPHYFAITQKGTDAGRASCFVFLLSCTEANGEHRSFGEGND